MEALNVGEQDEESGIEKSQRLCMNIPMGKFQDTSRGCAFLH